eukprot:scaffold4860_cov171-Amphora_coffeaeformis.AAC.2
MSLGSINDDASIASNEGMWAAEANYVASQNSKRVFLAMSIGMGDSHEVDLEKNPLSTIP